MRAMNGIVYFDVSKFRHYNLDALYILLYTMPLPRRTRVSAAQDEVANSFVFREGYPYQLILRYLVTLFGICISPSTLRRQKLQRRGASINLLHAGRCL